jgi:hypothetical protein
LLAIDRLDPDALCFVLNACQRVSASLDVLTDLPSKEADRAVIEMPSRGDTPWRIVRIGGASSSDVLRYARDESCLQFIASSVGDEEARRLWSSTGAGVLPAGISWVVVERRPACRPANSVTPIR